MPTADSLNHAVSAALLHNWSGAKSANESILKQKPDDIDALNRLAYAFVQLGKLKEAKRYYKKVILLDSYNQIAKKNLLKLNHVKKPAPTSSLDAPLSPSFFLEEPGKTKSISLINTAPFSILSSLTTGKEVFLCPKRHTIEVRDGQKIYLGALPDDLSFRLIRCLKAGNSYQVFTKNISKKSLVVFVKEITRSKKLRNQPSFIPQSADYQATIHKEVISEDADESKKGKDETFA